MSEDDEAFEIIANRRIDKLDPTKISSIRKAIGYFNLWYLIECRHCETLFLVEDSIDNRPTKSNLENITFSAYCPRCRTKNKVTAAKRLKLLFKRLAKNGEYDSYTMNTSRRMKLPKDVEEKIQEMRDIKTCEKNFTKTHKD
jgi:hypothetical protein